jgi:hypothetical protein
MLRDIQVTCQACNKAITVEENPSARIVDCPNCGNPVRIPDADERQEAQARKAAPSGAAAARPARRRWPLLAGVLVVLLLGGGLLYWDYHRQTLHMSDLERRVADAEMEAGTRPADAESLRLFAAYLDGSLRHQLHEMSDRWVAERKERLSSRLGKLIQEVEAKRGKGG